MLVEAKNKLRAEVVDATEGDEDNSLVGTAVREVLDEYEDADSAARALREMAEADDDLFHAIATPNMDRLCLDLVRRANMARNFRLRQSVKPLPDAGETSARLMRVAARKEQAWLDSYFIGRRRLGDMTGAELLPFAEQHEKVGRTELATARWLRAIAQKAKARIVRNVFNDDEIGRLREKFDREA